MLSKENLQYLQNLVQNDFLNDQEKYSELQNYLTQQQVSHQEIYTQFLRYYVKNCFDKKIGFDENFLDLLTKSGADFFENSMNCTEEEFLALENKVIAESVLRHAARSGNVEIINFLEIKYPELLKAKLLHQGYHKFTPLMLAAQENQVDVLRLLLTLYPDQKHLKTMKDLMRLRLLLVIAEERQLHF